MSRRTGQTCDRRACVSPWKPRPSRREYAMVSAIERWNIHPALPWMRGVRPEVEVEFNEQLNAWFVLGYQDVFDIISDPKTFSSRTAHLAAVTIDDSFNEGDVSQLDPPEQTK